MYTISAICLLLSVHGKYAIERMLGRLPLPNFIYWFRILRTSPVDCIDDFWYYQCPSVLGRRRNSHGLTSHRNGPSRWWILSAVDENFKLFAEASYGCTFDRLAEGHFFRHFFCWHSSAKNFFQRQTWNDWRYFARLSYLIIPDIISSGVLWEV